MSDRPGQLLVYDDAGNFIGGATALIAPTASVVNGRLSLPGVSEGIDGLPANPTASVGLAAVNGAATTFMRSDAAPALDQAISPTWTGPHVFNDNVTILGYTSMVNADVQNIDGTQAGFDDMDVANNITVGEMETASFIRPTVIGGSTSTVGDAAHPFTALFVGAAANGSMKLTGTFAANRVATFPDATMTVAGVDTAQTLTNKTLSSPALTGTPTAPTAAAATNTTQLATTAFVQTAVANLIDSSPGALDTLNELAAALGDDPNFAATVTTSLAGKQPLNTDLTTIAGLSPANDDIIQRVSGAWANRTLAQFKTSLALTTSDVAEGSRLYYTDERVDDRVAALIQGTANQITPTYSDAGGTLTLSLPQNIHTGASPQFTGLTLSGNLSAAGVASSLIPSTTDTYDLGSPTKLWRKGWLSELDAVLFAQNTVSLIGGWLMATKNEGAIPVGQDVGAGDATIDFGQAMTASDFVLFRAAGSVEYVQVGTLSAGTRYNVTRNLDGSGANAWPAGSVYAVLGNTTNGRIEINANSTPRISLIKQGATYNAQTELVRVGDLNGGWGYSSETYGFVAGEYAAGKAWLSVDPTNGLRIGLHGVINGQWDVSGNVTLGQVANDSGNAYWNNTTKQLQFRGGTAGTVVQAYIDTTGALVAAGGNFILDATGARFIGDTSFSATRAFTIAHPTSGQLLSTGASYDAGKVYASIQTNFADTGKDSDLTITSKAPTTNKTASLTLDVNSTTYGAGSLGVLANSSGVYVNVNAANGMRIGFAGPSIPGYQLTVDGGGYVDGNLAVNTDTLFVDSVNNRIGIGTASPTSVVDVVGSANGVVKFKLQNTNSGSLAFTSQQLVNDAGAIGVIFMNSSTNTQYGGANSLLLGNASNNPLCLGTNDTVRVTVSGAGAMRLHAYGAGTLTTDASGNVTATSDERSKDIQGNFTAGLDVLNRVDPIRYRWKAGTGLETAETYVGFSAQNVQKALAEAVGKNPDGMLTLQERALLAVIVNAVKELGLKVGTLERAGKRQN